jgi:hypothetical protein
MAILRQQGLKALSSSRGFTLPNAEGKAMSLRHLPYDGEKQDPTSMDKAGAAVVCAMDRPFFRLARTLVEGFLDLPSCGLRWRSLANI